MKEFAVLVVGAGPSGCEAAFALARRGLAVGLVTDSLDSVYRLERPVSGRPPPGSLLELAWNPDPWSLHRRAKYALEATAGLHLFQSSVVALLDAGDRVSGVRTWEGLEYRAGAVVLAVGSFLGARLRAGGLEEAAGRWGEAAYPDLYAHLRQRGFAFAPAAYQVPKTAETPAYQVSFQRFAAGEWEPESGRLPRLAGLYASGRVALGGVAPLERARLGRRLGLELTP
ncbi:FAD-dependent oxidoreductase [Oceanithermus sp.]